MAEISSTVHQQAVEEITQMLVESHMEAEGISAVGPDVMCVLKAQAETQLKESVEFTEKEYARFEKLYEDAPIKNYVKVLLEAHRKTLRRGLHEISPKISKETAKKIMDELFGPI